MHQSLGLTTSLLVFLVDFRLLPSCSIGALLGLKVYLYSSSPFFRASMTGPSASMDLLEKEL